MELAPRNDGANVHEAAKVEQDVNARVDLVMPALCLLEKFAVPVESAAGDGAGENIVAAEGARGPEDEEADGSGKEDIGLAIDPAAPETELDGFA